MTDRELMQMALRFFDWFYSDDHSVGREDFKATQQALRDRLAQPDPVRWERRPDGKVGLTNELPKREWVWLTNEEIEEIQFSDNGVDYELFDEGEYGTEINIYPNKFAKAVEAKLKEKNVG